MTSVEIFDFLVFLIELIKQMVLVPLSKNLYLGSYCSSIGEYLNVHDLNAKLFGLSPQNQNLV